MRGNILVLFSEFCLDLRKSILLLIVPDMQFFGELLAGWLVIVVGMLLDMEIVGVFSFCQSRVVQLPAPGERPEQFLFGLFRWIDAILQRLVHDRCPNSMYFLTLLSVMSPIVPA